MTLRTSLSLVLGSFLFAACNSTPSDKETAEVSEQDDGFQEIFNGSTLEGWHGDTAYWRVEDGNLVGEIHPDRPLKQNSFIIWQGGEPADFELQLEFRITEDGNSGVNYRSEAVEGIPYALRGYQADIDGKNRYTGQNYEERKRTTLAYRGEIVTVQAAAATGSLRESVKNNAWTMRDVTGSLGNADSLGNLIQAGDWNQCRIVAQGNRLQHYVNGVLMSDVTDADTVNASARGLLGMQVHVGPPMQVMYRNIRLKSL